MRHRTKLPTDLKRKRNHCRVALLWGGRGITDDSCTCNLKTEKNKNLHGHLTDFYIQEFNQTAPEQC